MPELPVNWELLWALKEMFAVGHVEAAQLAVDASPRFWELVGALPEHVSQAAGASPGDADMPDDTEPSRDGAEAPDDHEDRPRDDDGPDAAELEDMGKLYRAVGTQSARVRLTPRSSLAEVLAALKPAPEVEGARLVLAADPQTFAPAVAAWCRPIAELVKGRGPPAQRYADEMARLLGAWDGLLAVVPAPDQQLMVFASLAPGRSLEPDAWRAWLEPLLATAHVEGFGGVLVEEVQSDGRHVWRDAGGATALSYGFVDDIVWAATGEKAAPPVAALAAFRAARAVRGGAGAALAPVFRVDVPLDEAGLGLALQVHGDEVQISWQLTERER